MKTRRKMLKFYRLINNMNGKTVDKYGLFIGFEKMKIKNN